MSEFESYAQKLRKHDWSFEYSDDHYVWQKGVQSLGELQRLQVALDPLGIIWNSLCPSDYRLKKGTPMRVIYLASPYTHADPVVRNDRVEIASIAAAHLMMQGICVYSPITHGHRVAEHLPANMPHLFWMEQCLPLLLKCGELVVLPQEGWRTSKGLQEELNLARAMSLPISYIQDLPDGFGSRLEKLPGYTVFQPT